MVGHSEDRAARALLREVLRRREAPVTRTLTKVLTITTSVIPKGDCASIVQEAIMAQEAPAIHVGSDTRAKSQAEAMRDAEFAIRETGLAVSFTSDPHIAGTGTLNGAGVSVLVTCLTVGQRTFIEVVGMSLDSGAAEQARNRVRTITMGVPS